MLYVMLMDGLLILVSFSRNKNDAANAQYTSDNHHAVSEFRHQHYGFTSQQI